MYACTVVYTRQVTFVKVPKQYGHVYLAVLYRLPRARPLLRKQFLRLLREYVRIMVLNIRKFNLQEKGFCTSIGGRTFVHRAFVQGWHFIAACQVNMHFEDFIFSSKRVHDFTSFRPYKVRRVKNSIFLLGRLTLLSCKLTCHSTCY